MRTGCHWIFLQLADPRSLEGLQVQRRQSSEESRCHQKLRQSQGRFDLNLFEESQRRWVRIAEVSRTRLIFKIVLENWECLTLTEKRLKDQKNKDIDDGSGKDSSDPMGGLMNIMKKMYDSGDADMKRQIAKAWTEGQEKQRQNPF